MIRTKFEPAKHGFHFNNGTFRFHLGPLSCSVLCGGMSYAALDYFKLNLKPPKLTTAPANGNPLFDYLYYRQGNAHFYTWHKFAAAWSGSALPIVRPLTMPATAAAMQGDIKELQKFMPSQGPLVLCLFGEVTVGHHVLAIGCDPNKNTIELYDNNFHDKRSQITLQDGTWVHSISKKKWLGWFLDWGHYTEGVRIPPISWRYCRKCHGLFTQNFDGAGKCAAGGVHSPNMLYEYFLPCFTNEGERGWRVCSKCHGLFYSPSGQATGWCADSGSHEPMTKWNTKLEFGVAGESDQGEKNWHKCALCFGLFWSGSNGNGSCTIGGTHEKSKQQYAVDHRTV